jgi:hypothetical protein
MQSEILAAELARLGGRWSSSTLHSGAVDASASRRLTSGAVDDSASRSLTIWLGARRLQLLQPGTAGLCVYVFGAQEAKEGSDLASTARVFGLLRRLLAAEGVSSLHLVLCGPEVGCASSRATVVEAESLPRLAGEPDELACELTVQYLHGLYHEAVKRFPLPAAQLAVCFQPGLWGYDSWEPTVRQALQELDAPLLITSYTWEEADDDAGTLEGWGLPEGSAAWEWEAEPNPAASQRTVHRVVPFFSTEKREQLHDNCYWQCVRAGTYWP